MSTAAGQTALLAIDLQRAFCDGEGSMARQGRDIEPLRVAAGNADDLAKRARQAGITVIWTRMMFASDYSDGGQLAATIRPNLVKAGALRRGSGDEAFSALAHPEPEDIVIDKPRFSAWIGTSLEVVLRSGGYKRIIVCGVTTPMCVESTVRDLGQRDYETFVVEDACADFETGRHEASIAAMEFGFATIIDSARAMTLFDGAGHDRQH